MNHWPTKPLGDLLITLESGSRPRGGVGELSDGIPSVSGEHIDREGGFYWRTPKHITREFYAAMKRGRIQQGDILVVKDGATTGKTAMIRRDFPFGEAAINEHVFLLRTDRTRVLPEFVGYFLFSPIGQQQILSSFRGAAIGGIAQDFVRNVHVPLAPLMEQERIVVLLDEADRLRKLRTQADRRISEFIPALFHEMFGDPEDWKLKWRAASFGDVSSFVTSGSRGWAAYYADAGARFIRVQNLAGHKLNYEDIAFVKPPDTTEARRTRVQPNDLLLAITGNTIGLSALAPNDIGEAYVSQHVAIIRLNRSVYPGFLAAFTALKNGAQQQISEFQYGQTKPGLSLAQLRAIQLPLPPLPLQKKFAQRVAEIREMEAAQAQSHARLDALFASLMDKAFKGEL